MTWMMAPMMTVANIAAIGDGSNVAMVAAAVGVGRARIFFSTGGRVIPIHVHRNKYGTYRSNLSTLKGRRRWRGAFGLANERRLVRGACVPLRAATSAGSEGSAK